MHGRLAAPAALCLSAGGVSRAWREAVVKALHHLQIIAFPSNVKGGDVLTMLKRVAGTNLKTVCLEGCRQRIGDDVARILVRVAEGCPAAVEVKLAGCREEATLRALATASKRQLVCLAQARLLIGARCCWRWRRTPAPLLLSVEDSHLLVDVPSNYPERVTSVAPGGVPAEHAAVSTDVGQTLDDTMASSDLSDDSEDDGGVTRAQDWRATRARQHNHCRCGRGGVGKS